jgi:hypothetical protein
MATKHKPAPAATDDLAKLRRQYGCGPSSSPRASTFSRSGAPGAGRSYWRAADYLSVGQVCLMDNPLLKADRLPRAHRRTDVPLHEPVGHAR